MSDDSPDYNSPIEIFADNEKSKSSSKRSSPSSESSSKNKEQDLRKTINEKKAAGKPFSKETRQLTVLKHFNDIRSEQKDYKTSIKQGENSEAIKEKLFKLEENAEAYSKKFIAGKMSEDLFRDRAVKTIENLKDFLSTLPKFVSLADATKALLKKEKKVIKKIKDYTGAPPPIIKKIPPKMTSPTLKKPTEDDKPTIIDSILNAKIEKQTRKKSPPRTINVKPKLKITRKKKLTYTKAPRKAKKAETYKREGQQITGKPSRPSTAGHTPTNTVHYPPTGITRGARTPPKIKPRTKETTTKQDSPDSGFEWKPEYEMPVPIKKTKTRKNKDSPGILKPQRNLNTMSNTNIIKLFKSIPELKWPPKISKKQKAQHARDTLKKYFQKQSPGRRLKTTVEYNMPARWHPPMTTEGLSPGRTHRARKHNIVVKRTTKKIKLPKHMKRKPPKPGKRNTAPRKTTVTNVIFDPQYPENWKLKNKKFLRQSPKLNMLYNVTQEQKPYDPRPSWDYTPPKHATAYENFKKEGLKIVQNTTEGNQFRLAQTINALHRVLQTHRAKLDSFNPPKNFKPLDDKTRKWLSTLKKDSNESTAPVPLTPLLIKIEGYIRPRKTILKLNSKTKKGKYSKESPKKAPTKTIYKRIPVDVLTAPIPPHYSRVDTMLLPPSAGSGSKSQIKKARRPVKTSMVLRSPNWVEIEATGLKTTSKNVIYHDVTREDLENYLGRTYLVGYDNHFNGGDIKIREEDRVYAYESAIDLRRCRGTVLESGAVVITRTELEKTQPKVVGAPGTSKTTEEKAIEKAYDLSRRIYDIYQKHNPKTTLKQKGKKKVTETITHLTEEQYINALKGKDVEGLPMTSHQITKIVKKLQSSLKELIAIQSSVKDLDTIDKVESHINQITKFIETIKKGHISRGPDPIKRKAPKKKKGVSIFLRGKKGRGSSPSSSSTSGDRSGSKKSPQSSKKSSSSSTLSDLALEMEAEMKKLSPGEKEKKGKGKTITEFIEEVRQEEEEKRALRAAGIHIPREYPEMFVDPSRPVTSYLG